MQFRTPIDVPSQLSVNIDHNDRIVMLGSCFTDNIGAILERDGFTVTYNPMGPLYNPESILEAIKLALSSKQNRKFIIKTDDNGTYHCLNFASRYTSIDYDKLKTQLNAELDQLKEKIEAATTIILTLGTAYIYKLKDAPCKGLTVGNCHKFPASHFERVRITAEEVESCINDIMNLAGTDKKVLFTVSPIRHLGDGMHENQISKATLLLALDKALNKISEYNSTNSILQYFPSYEIMMDDLRDYRFYASDMKHPSEIAIEYIYEIFSKYYFTTATMEKSIQHRKESLRKAHRPILKDYGTSSI